LFNNILVCLDGSKLAEQILPLTEEQALHFSSRVTLLQIVPVPEVAVVQAGATYKDANIEEQIQIATEKAKPYMEDIAKTFKEKGIPVEVVIQEGSSIGKAIIEFSQKHHIDLIAIATHGHGGLGRLVFGSVADYILRTSGLPMLLIRPKAF
jgi:nucleotide-binding universal stress UspA family protein